MTRHVVTFKSVKVVIKSSPVRLNLSNALQSKQKDATASIKHFTQKNLSNIKFYCIAFMVAGNISNKLFSVVFSFTFSTFLYRCWKCTWKAFRHLFFFSAQFTYISTNFNVRHIELQILSIHNIIMCFFCAI